MDNNATPASLASGSNQLGPYKLLRKIGEGGMGTVYLAEDTGTSRQVALKVLSSKLATDAESIMRFRREVKAASKFNHINIVASVGFGEERGHLFYAMEYCEGEPMDQRLKRLGKIPWLEAFEIVMQVTRGLEHAHDQGFIHRDIKPDNIVVTPEGVAKILDLGLAKSIMHSNQSFYTDSGITLGTAHYISPEQARGDRKLDGRTDIYSLGATLYHMLTGTPPFHESTGVAILVCHVDEQLSDPRQIQSDIPARVVQVLQKMMAKTPEDRYCDGGLLVDLELVLAGKEPMSHPLSAPLSTIALGRARK